MESKDFYDFRFVQRDNEDLNFVNSRQYSVVLFTFSVDLSKFSSILLKEVKNGNVRGRLLNCSIRVFLDKISL